MGRPDYVLGQFGQRLICLLSPALAQTTGVNKSVSFARWQQGAGFVVSRTTACFIKRMFDLILCYYLITKQSLPV